MFKIIRRIDEGAVTPSNWWGLCWYENYGNVRVIAPIPLNLLVALARRWHEKMAFTWVNKLQRGAQFSRHQHNRALRKVHKIVNELSAQDRIDVDATGTELTPYHHPDLSLYQYLANVLSRDLHRAPRNVR